MVRVDGRVTDRHSTGTPNRPLANQYAAELERRLYLGGIGLTDPYAEHRDRPITEHLAGYEQALQDGDRNEDYAKQSINRIRTLLGLAGIKTTEEFDLERVRRALGMLKEQGRSAATRNTYLASMAAFGGWLVETKKMVTNPLVGEKKSSTAKDRRRQRRALSPEQLQQLMEAAAKGDVVEGIAGTERALAYVMAAYTGFRRRALASLRAVDFDLDAGTASLPAQHNKSGKDVVAQPLRPEVMVMVRDFIEAQGLGPQDRLLRKLTKHASSGGIQADLAAAGIPYQDERGHFADLHALRGLFNTWMASAGVGRGARQTLLGVSSERLVSTTYCYQPGAELRAAVDKLPAPPAISFSTQGKAGKV